MLNWVITFLILALVAAVFGFTGIMVASIEIARILFIIFLVLFLATLVMHLIGSRKNTDI